MKRRGCTHRQTREKGRGEGKPSDAGLQFQNSLAEGAVESSREAGGRATSVIVRIMPCA